MLSQPRRVGISIALGDLNISASLFQLIGNFFCLSFSHAFFDVFRSTIYQVFCFFQSKTCNVFHDLNNIQFVGTTAFQHYVECSLFFSRCSSSTTTSWTSHSYSSSCRL